MPAAAAYKLRARMEARPPPQLVARAAARRPAPQRMRDATPRLRTSILWPQRDAMRVSSPEEPAEREAQATARSVMSMSAGRVYPPGTVARAAHRRVHAHRIHRQAAGPQPAVAEDLSQEIQASLGAGMPLPEDVREFMEPRFRADFGAVTIHTDQQAERLSARLSARAFTYGKDIYFARGEYRPDTPEGAELLAHELTHTIQQQAVVQRSEEPEVKQRSPSLLQRLGLSDILDGLADLAANVPGFTLLTLIIGRNPINLRRVEFSTINLLRAFMGIIPGGDTFFQVLNRNGVAQRIATWVDEQMKAMGLTFQSIADAFTRFTDSLGFSDLFSPGDVWRRAQNVFTPTLTRIRNFVAPLIAQAITWLKETLMQPLANFCGEIPGYGIVKVMLGRDPFTNAAVARTPLNVVRAFAEFIPGGTEKVDQLVQSRALERAYQWFQTETQARNLTWERVTGTFAEAWASLRLEDVLTPLDTLRRMMRLFRPLLTDLVDFARAALMKLAELIFAAAMGAGGTRIVAIFMRARDTFNVIIADPVRFLRHCLDAIRQGVRQFMNNILTHLRNGVIAWLTGPVARAGIEVPAVWDLRGIIWFVMQILGLTWPNIRLKLVRLMGERPVSMLEGAFQLIQEIRERGLVQALRDRVNEFFGSLREAALGAIKGFIQQRLVMAGIQQLISLLSPVGAVIQAIIKTYTTIKFFIDKINEILDFVESVVNSIADMAAGRIGPAANRVEQTLARTIPIILDFLARFIGLGNVGEQVQTTIRSIQARVDGMLDRAVDWIRRQAAGLASRALGGDPNAPPQQRLQQGVQEAQNAVNRLSGSTLGRAVITPVLAAIRVRHRLRSLDVEPENGRWVIVGEVNPRLRGPTAKTADPDLVPAGTYPSRVSFGSGRTLSHGGRTLTVGNRMTADPLGPDLIGQGTSVQPAARTTLAGFIGASRQSEYRVGHLLNHHLGGSGSNWLNLTPLSPSGNALHSTRAETDVRDIVQGRAGTAAQRRNRWVFYDVVPRYQGHSSGPAAERLFATSLDIQWQRMEPSGGRLRRVGSPTRVPPITLTLP
jgi:hypothetical protein